MRKINGYQKQNRQACLRYTAALSWGAARLFGRCTIAASFRFDAVRGRGVGFGNFTHQAGSAFTHPCRAGQFSWREANPLVQLDKFEKHALIIAGQRRQYWQVKDSQPMIWGATAAMLMQLAILLEDAK